MPRSLSNARPTVGAACHEDDPYPRGWNYFHPLFLYQERRGS